MDHPESIHNPSQYAPALFVLRWKVGHHPQGQRGPAVDAAQQHGLVEGHVGVNHQAADETIVLPHGSLRGHLAQIAVQKEEDHLSVTNALDRAIRSGYQLELALWTGTGDAAELDDALGPVPVVDVFSEHGILPPAIRRLALDIEERVLDFGPHFTLLRARGGRVVKRNR